MEKETVNLNESKFTNICKSGFYVYTFDGRRNEISFTKRDIKKLAEGETVTKRNIDIMIYGMSEYLVKEIIKRSPIYSELHNELK